MANMGYDDQMLGQTPHAGMSERVHSPWAGDYDLPPSVDPVSSIFQIQGEVASQLIATLIFSMSGYFIKKFQNT